VIADQPAASLSGPLRFARYAFMPNRLGYCGGDDNRALYDYAVASIVDRGLAELLGRFSGAMPYLRLIARTTGIGDPFDPRVVEAYWLGNDLLWQVEARQLYDHLAERFAKQLNGRARELVLGKAPAGARPHHSFHVFDVYTRTGDAAHTLTTMDNCRVSWGRVVRIDGAEIVVERQPLELQAGRLALGASRQERAVRQMDGRGFADAAAVGEWVSLHWGWVCERITDLEQRHLERFTRHHLQLASATL
jgi:hypothetical protein